MQINQKLNEQVKILLSKKTTGLKCFNPLSSNIQVASNSNILKSLQQILLVISFQFWKTYLLLFYNPLAITQLFSTPQKFPLSLLPP